MTNAGQRTAARTRLRPLGALGDGTPYFAPLGEVERDEEVVRCHLCGGWYRSVNAHLRAHGVDRSTYLEMFGLERGARLEGSLTRKRRSVALTTRQVTDPAIRTATAAAVARARSGELTAAATRANTGRAHPAQRRAKTLAALAAVRPQSQARANRKRADEQLLRTADEAAARRGFPDLPSYVMQGLAAGRSLTALSAAIGLHKDWLSRHFDRLVDDSSWRRQLTVSPEDPRWGAVLAASGAADVGAYLRQQHLVERKSVAAIAMESGLGRTAIHSAMTRHDVPVHPYATGRRRAGMHSPQSVQER